ncbi:acyl-CoA dehydrogenase family protein [Spirillospora sp. CA-294931]|uniref:acyl-CoA dehydrogenase family protein n=1 Tax=Spirillospora sp. CA-294931 TaxID=3240042 RepID=UPI003D9481A7
MDDERREFAGVLRRFFEERSAADEVRRLMVSADGHDPGMWRRMAGMGLLELELPELAVVFEEMGRALVCAPFLSTVMGLAALRACGEEELASRVQDGSALVTLAWDEGGAWDLGAVGMLGGTRLRGTKNYVLDGHLADVLLVVALDGDEPALYAVEGAGVRRIRLTTLDQTRRLAHLEFDGAPARRIGDADAVRRALEVGMVCLAAEQLGGAQRVLEMAVEYAKVRHQFGRPIGGFQAIKHKCADMFVQVESARSVVLRAASDLSAAPWAAPLAQAFCSDAYFFCAAENIQIHGGIGFTWEHDAHLYFKRAKSSQELFGPPALHRARLAGMMS